MEKKTMTNAFDSMDLNTAYEIAGGYIEADDEIFAKALEMVKADDARFAEELKAARKAEISLKAQQDKEEEIAASAEEVLDNTSFLKQEFGNDKFQQDFLPMRKLRQQKKTPLFMISIPKRKNGLNLKETTNTPILKCCLKRLSWTSGASRQEAKNFII